MIKMNEEIKEKLDLNPKNMNEIAKEAYYKLENYIFTLEKVQNNWNELTKWVIEQEQKAWDEVSSTFGYVLNKMQELEGNNE